MLETLPERRPLGVGVLLRGGEPTNVSVRLIADIWEKVTSGATRDGAMVGVRIGLAVGVWSGSEWVSEKLPEVPVAVRSLGSTLFSLQEWYGEL